MGPDSLAIDGYECFNLLISFLIILPIKDQFFIHLTLNHGLLHLLIHIFNIVFHLYHVLSRLLILQITGIDLIDVLALDLVERIDRAAIHQLIFLRLFKLGLLFLLVLQHLLLLNISRITRQDLYLSGSLYLWICYDGHLAGHCCQARPLQIILICATATDRRQLYRINLKSIKGITISPNLFDLNLLRLIVLDPLHWCVAGSTTTTTILLVDLKNSRTEALSEDYISRTNLLIL